MSNIDQRKYEMVRAWLKSLGALSAGSMPLAEAEARVNAYAPMLAEDFDGGAFCAASLNAVARSSKWFPAYGEVVERLGDWWRENRTLRTAIAAPDDPDALDEAEQSWVRYFERRISEARDPALVLSMVRGKGGKRALAKVLRANPRFEGICAARQWVDSDEELVGRLGRLAVPVRDGLWVV